MNTWVYCFIGLSNTISHIGYLNFHQGHGDEQNLEGLSPLLIMIGDRVMSRFGGFNTFHPHFSFGELTNVVLQEYLPCFITFQIWTNLLSTKVQVFCSNINQPQDLKYLGVQDIFQFTCKIHFPLKLRLKNKHRVFSIFSEDLHVVAQHDQQYQT